MPTASVSPEELAARLAAKLCHDFISPAGAIVSGLDLLDDPSAKDMRDEAMDLIAASARKLTDHLAFARVAFGTSAGSESFELGGVGTSRPGRVRPRPGRVGLGGIAAELAQARVAGAVEPRPTGLPRPADGRRGAGRGDRGGGRLSPLARAEGARVRLHPEVKSGLEGEALGDGLAGRWVQAYYVQAVARSGGGHGRGRNVRRSGGLPRLDPRRG